MKNIDYIIRYLAGEMEEDEKAAFEKRITDDPGLREQKEEVRNIWNVIREELSLEDLTGKESKEELIAAVMAEQDIHEYGNRSPSENERSFRSKTSKLTNKTVPGGKERNVLFKPDFRMGLLLAAAVALFIVLVKPASSAHRLAGNYYNPSEMSMLEEQSIQTRNEDTRAARLFLDGNYKAARYLLETGGKPGIEEPVFGLMYAITCYETGDTASAIQLLEQLSALQEAPASYEARWYLSLILVRQDQSENALPYLSRLADMDGKYRGKSRKMIRRINRNMDDR